MRRWRRTQAGGYEECSGNGLTDAGRSLILHWTLDVCIAALQVAICYCFLRLLLCALVIYLWFGRLSFYWDLVQVVRRFCAPSSGKALGTSVVYGRYFGRASCGTLRLWASRVAHGCLYALLLSFLSTVFARGPSILLAYFLVLGVAGSTGYSHGAWCRPCTCGSVLFLTWANTSFAYAVLALFLTAIGPNWCLWWAPKKSDVELAAGVEELCQWVQTHARELRARSGDGLRGKLRKHNSSEEQKHYGFM